MYNMFIHLTQRTIAKEGGKRVDPQKISLMFKALSDETRVKIILELMKGEQCACHLLKNLHLTQPVLSHHMQILCASGLVESQRAGRWMHFALNMHGVAEAQTITQRLFKVTEKDPFSSMSCCP